MKRYGICYRTPLSPWNVAFIDAHSDQSAIAHLLALPLCEDLATLCIGHVVEWKGESNGQYILTAA